MIIGSKPVTRLIQHRAFDLAQKRAGFIRQVAPDNQGGTTVPVEVLCALNEIT